MTLEILQRLPLWEWPESATSLLVTTLQSASASVEERTTAAQLSAGIVAMNDDLADILLAIVCNQDEPDALRGTAAISLGPGLEEFDWDEPDDEDASLTTATVDLIQERFKAIINDDSVPLLVRRRVLEAAVRISRDWHSSAVQGAWDDGHPDWRLTAVFCMSYVRGFDSQIIEALTDANTEVVACAMRAAGAYGVKAAWPTVNAILTEDAADETLLLAALEAATGLRSKSQALAILDRFVRHTSADVRNQAKDLTAELGGYVEDDDDAW